MSRSVLSKDERSIKSQLFVNLPLSRIITWLLECCEKNLYAIICDVLETFKILVKGITDKSQLPLDYLIGNQGLFIQLINKSNGKPLMKDVEEYRNDEIILSVVLCLDALIVDSSSVEKVDFLSNVGQVLLTLMYSANAKEFGEMGFCTLMATSLGEFRIRSQL